MNVISVISSDITIHFIYRIHFRKQIEILGVPQRFKNILKWVSPAIIKIEKCSIYLLAIVSILSRAFNYFPCNPAIPALKQPFFALSRHSDVKSDSHCHIKRLITKGFFLASFIEILQIRCFHTFTSIPLFASQEKEN